MKKQTDNQKAFHTFRRLMKAGLFLPIFYTVIFGLGIVSVIVLPEAEVQNRYLVIFGSSVVILLFWVRYAYEKKREKSLFATVDQLEVELTKATDDLPEIEQVEAMSEDERLTAQRIETITDKVKIVSVCSILFIVSFAVVGILFYIQDLVEWPIVVFVAVYLVFGLCILCALFIGILNYVKIIQFAKTASKKD